MPWPVYCFTVAQPAARAIGSLRGAREHDVCMSGGSGGHAHDLADVAPERAGLAHCDRGVQCVARGLHHADRVLVDLADGVRLVQVRVEA
jgi:hypothetical protein